VGSDPSLDIKGRVTADSVTRPFFFRYLNERDRLPSMTWDDHYRRWQEALSGRRNAEAFEHLQTARKRVAENGVEDWEWLTSALADPNKKWFVAKLFQRQPIPRRLLAAMMQSAVIDVNASTNRYLIEPCVATFGREVVVAELEQLRKNGVATEVRYECAMYWLRRDTSFSRATRPPSDDA
jgi:hypothetical protein